MLAALLLAAFAFAVAADPVLDALAPHKDECPVCAALLHQMAPADAAPALASVILELDGSAPDVPLTLLASDHPLHLSRGPPAS